MTIKFHPLFLASPRPLRNGEAVAPGPLSQGERVRPLREALPIQIENTYPLTPALSRWERERPEPVEAPYLRSQRPDMDLCSLPHETEPAVASAPCLADVSNQRGRHG